jgi:uncharacterized protein
MDNRVTRCICRGTLDYSLTLQRQTHRERLDKMKHLKESYLSTFSGKKFYPFNPSPEQIEIVDIAHGLSMVCRFSGQCPYFYSVAEHCIHVTNALPPSLKLEGLLHDASEAYLADLPKPVKMGLRDYSLLETQVETVIAEKFNLACPTPSEVKTADLAMLKQEIFSFFGPARYSEDFQDPPGQSQHFSGFEPQVAESKFLELFCSLALASR